MFNFIFRRVLPILALAFAASAAAQTTITLQQSLNSYGGTTDTFIKSTSATTNFGTQCCFDVLAESVASGLMRFAIFQSEGGPIPNTANITSATLSLYKYSGPQATLKVSRLLKNWTETGATWNTTGTGANWTTAGANSPGNDYLATPDAQAFVADAPGCNGQDGGAVCWIHFDVTSGVQAFKAGTANFGWKIAYVSGGTASIAKQFNQRNNNGFMALRPKLTITYGDGSCNSGTLRPFDGAPINGSPIAISASAATTFEAEHFNCGGQDVAYHDNVAGNNGAAFRATEDVDIIASTDPAGGGYVIQNFYTGEWLTYTINVAQTGTYDLAIRASADNPGSFHFEIDGVNVSGNVPVPNTGSLNNYVWVSKTGISLTAGQHVLKLVSDQQFFWVNQLRITPSGPTPPTAHLSADVVSGVGPFTVTFNASGTSDGGSQITNLRLDFGDGTPVVNWQDKNQVQQHQYAAVTTQTQYTASLVATNALGDSAPPATQTITVNPPGGQEFASGEPLAPNGETVPTFHSMSLYMNLTAAPTGNRVFVRYRKATDDPLNPAVWKSGYPLFYDARDTNPGCPANNCFLPYTGAAGVQRLRGSVVHLEPGVKYVFELGTGPNAGSVDWQWHLVGTTWAESADKSWPETLAQDGPAIPINSQSEPLVITAGGTAATGYKVYDGCQTYQGSVCTAKRVINRGGTADIAAVNTACAAFTVNSSSWRNCVAAQDLSYGIVVKDDFVVIRNVHVTGAALSGIRIAQGVTNVVVENSQIDDFAYRPGVDDPAWDAVDNPNPNSFSDPDPWGWNGGAGVSFARNNSRILVQRTMIKNPRYGSFPWDTLVPGASVNCDPTGSVADPAPDNHPLGAVGIEIWEGGRQNVIRYNEITSDPANKKKWFFDGIYGGENFGPAGTPGADSDIYQNIIMHVFDDGIEAEGGGRNVRVWGNYFSDVKTAIATSTIHFGPTYAWRNVVNRVRSCHQQITDQDDDWFSAAFKVAGRKGNSDEWGDGLRYLFHNTLLQEPGTGTRAEGAGKGLEADGNGAPSATWTIARNNIFHVREDIQDCSSNCQGWSVESGAYNGGTPPGVDFAFNLYNGRFSSVLPNFATLNTAFVDNEVRYKLNHGYSSVPALGGGGTGNYQLDTGSKGLGVGDPLPNFSDGYSGTAPDIGAHEEGTPAMKFGISATP